MSNLAVKIAKASLIVGGKLTPDKRNTQDRYEYVSADQILSAGGQALAEAGVACLPSVTSAEVLAFDRGSGKNRYDARVQFVFILADDESTMELVWVGYGSDYTVPDKAVYKAITSGHRYFLAKLLNIGAGNEDGEHDSGKDDDRKGSGVGNVAGSINNGSGPCPICFAPVGKTHLPRCTATSDPQPKGQATQKSSEPAPDPDIGTLNDVEELDFDGSPSSATEEFNAIPSQTPGMVNGQPTGATKITPAILRKLQAQFTATFNGLDVDDARHWYIEKWTAKHTPDNMRKSASTVTDAEAEIMISELKKYTKGLRSTFEALAAEEVENIPA